MDLYHQQVLSELTLWQKQMLSEPTFLDRFSKKVQTKINRWIPEKVHEAITATIKQMIRGVLFSAELVSVKTVNGRTLKECEQEVVKRIEFYRTTAAVEGGITGAGGILLGLADFPILLGLKIKLLFEIGLQYAAKMEDYKERVYLLHIFELAFSGPEHRKKIYLSMLNWNAVSATLPDDIHQFDWRNFQQEYRDYIDLAKMAQLIPVIGAPVGAVVNYRLIKKLGNTAMNAYRMRIFAKNKNIDNQKLITL